MPPLVHQIDVNNFAQTANMRIFVPHPRGDVDIVTPYNHQMSKIRSLKVSPGQLPCEQCIAWFARIVACKAGSAMARNAVSVVDFTFIVIDRLLPEK